MKLEKPFGLGALLAVMAVGAGVTAQAPATSSDPNRVGAPPATVDQVPVPLTTPSTERSAPTEIAPSAVLSPPIEESAFGDTLTRHALVSEVLARNPEVAAAESAWQAALARIPQAASLDDPMASHAIAPLSIGSSDATFGQELRLSQRLPFPGKRGLRREAATADAAAGEQRLGEARLRVATLASLLYDQLWLLDRQAEVANEHLRLLAAFQRVATARYASGLAPQQAPLQAEVETARVEQRLVEIRAERRRMTARLNALLHRPADAPLPVLPAQLSVAPAAETQAEAAIDSRPELRAQEAELEARRAAVELARLGVLPDLEVMTSFSTMWDMREHRWMVGVGVNLPIWRQRRRAAVTEAEAELAADEAELATLEDQVRQEVASARASVDETDEVLRLQRDRLLPAARDQLAAARAAFESGAGDMLAVIEAERGLRTAQLDYYATLASAASRRAELQRALGILSAPAEVTP